MSITNSTIQRTRPFSAQILMVQDQEVVLSTFIDISERKRTEVALRQSEARLNDQKRAFELAVGGAPLRDVLGELAAAAQRQFGPDARAAIFLTEPGGERLRFAVAAGMPESYTHAVDGFEIRPDKPACGSAAYMGQPVIARDVATDPLWAPYLHLAEAHEIRACWSFPIKSSSVKVLGTLAVYHRVPREPGARDMESAKLLAETASIIIERYKGEEARRVSEQRFREAVDNFPSVYVIYDEQRRIQYINAAGLKVSGRPESDFLGKRDDEVWPDEVTRRYLPQLLKAYETRQTQTHEMHMVLPNGNEYWQMVTYVPLLDEADRIRQVLGITHDITGIKQAEKQLKELNATLERRVAERTVEAEQRAEQLRALAAELTRAEQRERQRLATILHDHLQQLLVGTKFHLGILRGQRKERDLQQSLEQIDSLLDQSLDASRNLTADLSPPILKHGNMTQVLHWLAEWMANKHGLHVKIRADERANPQSHEIRVLLFQAVRELLFNIAKHARVGEATVELCRLGQQYVRVAVRDEGVGFDASKGRSAGGNGSGFGLFAIRERLNWLGGTFQLDSRPAGGTCATLTVPVGLSMAIDTDEIQAAVHAVEGVAASDAPRSVQAGRAIRVLLADDHAVMRDGLSSLLQRQLDVEVVGKATDGQEAVDLAEQLRPDVIIMDISMPRLDGVEATCQIKARHPHIQVIGLSMFNDDAAARSMKEAGAVCYLAKTSGPDALIKAIRQCASSKVPPDASTS